MCLQDLQDGCFGKIVQEHLARPIICQIEQEDLSRDAAHERLTLISGFLKPLMSGERKIVLIK